jgi:hypothetical protein
MQRLSDGGTRTFDAGLYDLNGGVERIRPPAEALPRTPFHGECLADTNLTMNASLVPAGYPADVSECAVDFVTRSRNFDCMP